MDRAKIDDAYLADKVDEEGRLLGGFTPPPSWLGEEFIIFERAVSSELADWLFRTIRVARWRYNALGSHAPFGGRPPSWSPDGSSWKPFPWSTRAYASDAALLRPMGSAALEIQRLTVGGINEPLGHQMFREAWDERHHNPRSALMVAIAGLEVGFKQLVIQLAPQTDWLMREIQSPPVDKMLANYLPTLEARNTIPGRTPQVPREIRRLVGDGLKMRNDLAHRGEYAILYDALEPVLLAVRDCLWLFDFYLGYTWALDYVREETRQQLGLPKRWDL
jgi:hypothetical protein